LRWARRVNRGTLHADLAAGAVVVLPQGIAFATLAGLPPQYGLYAAMVPAVVASLWGSSSRLVSGPTNAISLVVFAAMAQLAEPGSAQYVSLVITLTFVVGLIQLVMGLARLGVLVDFISHTVVMGSTKRGAALAQRLWSPSPA
jgi:SulP family sulfate permease